MTFYGKTQRQHSRLRVNFHHGHKRFPGVDADDVALIILKGHFQSQQKKAKTFIVTGRKETLSPTKMSRLQSQTCWSMTTGRWYRITFFPALTKQWRKWWPSLPYEGHHSFPYELRTLIQTNPLVMAQWVGMCLGFPAGWMVTCGCRPHNLCLPASRKNREYAFSGSKTTSQDPKQDRKIISSIFLKLVTSSKVCWNRLV